MLSVWMWIEEKSFIDCCFNKWLKWLFNDGNPYKNANKSHAENSGMFSFKLIQKKCIKSFVTLTNKIIIGEATSKTLNTSRFAVREKRKK